MGGLSLRAIIHPRKIRFGIKTIGIWPLNPKAMDNKIISSEVDIELNLNNAKSEKEYTI
jgi:hypothetical protein